MLSGIFRFQSYLKKKTKQKLEEEEKIAEK
jgi:hypothetical protein